MIIKVYLSPELELRLRYISAELDRTYDSLIEAAAKRPPEVTPC